MSKIHINYQEHYVDCNFDVALYNTCLQEIFDVSIKINDFLK